MRLKCMHTLEDKHMDTPCFLCYHKVRSQFEQSPALEVGAWETLPSFPTGQHCLPLL